MAKKPSLLEAVKALPARRRAVTFEGRLNADQKKEFSAALEWFRGAPDDSRPTQREFLEAVKKSFGVAPTREKLREMLRAK